MKYIFIPLLCIVLFSSFTNAQIQLPTVIDRDPNVFVPPPAPVFNPGGGAQNTSTGAGAQVQNTDTRTTNTRTSLINLKIRNPLGVSSVQGLLKRILELLLTIATPIAVLFLLYSGFLFVEARGNSEKLKKAKAVFWNTIIGVAILLGAYTISIVVTETVRSIIE